MSFGSSGARFRAKVAWDSSAAQVLHRTRAGMAYSICLGIRALFKHPVGLHNVRRTSLPDAFGQLAQKPSWRRYGRRYCRIDDRLSVARERKKYQLWSPSCRISGGTRRPEPAQSAHSLRLFHLVVNIEHPHLTALQPDEFIPCRRRFRHNPGGEITAVLFILRVLRAKGAARCPATPTYIDRLILENSSYYY